MPRASGQKFHYQDHDTDVVDMAPPVQNTWYEVFDAEDVNLLWCVVRQDNTEAGAKALEVRWTIDGNVYYANLSANDASEYWINRDHPIAGVGLAGLASWNQRFLATYYAGKKGHSFKVEVRITAALGTNQRLRCWCVRETLELT